MYGELCRPEIYVETDSGLQRAILGLGAAGIFSGALVIIAHSTPVHKRPVYTGIVGAMYGLASVVGPLIGGAFTDKLTVCLSRLPPSSLPVEHQL